MQSSKMDLKIKQYENTVVEYIRKSHGAFIVASQDTTFHSVLRNTINKQLAVTDDCIISVLDENNILKALRDTMHRRKNIVVFIERVFNNKETAFLVKQIKNAFNDVKVVILTGETDRQRLVLLHEIGADNFISKPISMNILIEKIAFTIKPQGKIGKLIDKGKQLVSQEQFEESLKTVRQILDIKPNSAAGYLILGDAYKGLGKKEKAVEAYESACEHASMYMEPLKKLAEFYEEEGDHENRLRYLEKLDKLSPLNVERKVDMGGIHVEMGNDDKAEVLFDHAINQAKREAMSYIEEISSKIGGIYEKRDPDRAVKYYRKAIELKGDMLDKSDIKIFNALGIALRRQGKWREAVDEYHKARTVSPEDENLLYNIALAYAEGKEMRKATEHLEKALQLNPEFHMQDPVIAYNFGLIYTKARKSDEARQFLEASLTLNPGFDKAKTLLDSL